MKSIYVLTVENNLTKQDQCDTEYKNYERDIKVYTDFESAKTGMRSIIKEFATSKNDIFDGNGNIIGFDAEHLEMYVPKDFDTTDDNPGWGDIPLMLTGEFSLPIQLYITQVPPFIKVNTFNMTDPDKTYVVRLHGGIKKWEDASFVYLELRKVNVE